jgi:hypothetical protein
MQLQAMYDMFHDSFDYIARNLDYPKSKQRDPEMFHSGDLFLSPGGGEPTSWKCHQDVSANMTYPIQTRFGRHILEGIMARMPALWICRLWWTVTSAALVVKPRMDTCVGLRSSWISSRGGNYVCDLENPDRSFRF